jgi:hypothetical protein
MGGRALGRADGRKPFSLNAKLKISVFFVTL